MGFLTDKHDPCQWCLETGSTSAYSGSPSAPKAFSPAVKICATCERAHYTFSEAYIQLKSEGELKIGRAAIVHKAQHVLGEEGGVKALAYLQVAEDGIDLARRLMKSKTGKGKKALLPWIKETLPKWRNGFGNLTTADFEILRKRIKKRLKKDRKAAKRAAKEAR